MKRKDQGILSGCDKPLLNCIVFAGIHKRGKSIKGS